MNHFSRRRFLQTTVAGTAALAAFPWLKSFGNSPNDTIRMGFIGLGQQTNNLIGGFNKIPGCRSWPAPMCMISNGSASSKG